MATESQRVLVLTASEIKMLLPMSECIEVMSSALADLTRGTLLQPLRMVVRPPEALGVMALMPAYRRKPKSAYGLKAICFFHENPATFNKDAHQGCVLLSSGETGELLAMMNASAITAIRTAAVSAVAAKLLSREDAHDLAIVGSGIQARMHLHALSKVRSIKRARVVSLNTDHAKQLAEEMNKEFPFQVEPMTNVEATLDRADLIVTATSAREPVVRREWIADGSHITAIGTYSPESREIDSATMAVARIYVDRRESALNEAGDYILAAKDGLITPENIVAEIGEVLLGQAAGRTSDRQITLFKSLGLAIEDLACAEYLFEKARNHSVGTWIPFE
ncbi:MAG TPA: ornithine cyclodeaminase family protein [Pyrinomonadaceae bacterium]|nr:ornithine cyclodeaminase family protein [Pyrinomonadaceae bacterium]